jgi:hypothetical protein
MKNRTDDTVIGKCRFLDGADRDVYQTPEGRQYVYDECDLRVHGIWILPEEADAAVPVLASARSSGRERPS